MVFHETAASVTFEATTSGLEAVRLWLALRRVLTEVVKALTAVKRSAVEVAVAALGSG